MDLFSTNSTLTPLPERVRPTCLDEVIGQEHLVGPKSPLRLLLENKQLFSFVFWGPPGTGKTTLAQIVAKESDAHFVPFSAVLSGIKEIKTVMQKAKMERKNYGKSTLVFVDEIHRFNKAQQDAFLPFVEKGDIILIGATTENPSFEINGALLSRMRVFVLNPLSSPDIFSILNHALETDEYLLKKKSLVSTSILEWISKSFSSDARSALNILDLSLSLLPKDQQLTKQHIQQIADKKILHYDKDGEEHFNIISALHKSIRNSDANASLYWLARMLEAGEDPLYVVRRLIRFASEDIGNADPSALPLAVATQQTIHFIGMPEANTALAQLVIYLSAAPKSNSAYVAYKKVQGDIRKGKVYPVPLAIRNAPTKLMKNLNYGKDYQYAHNTNELTTSLQCLPDEIKDTNYYTPKKIGEEREVARRLEYFERLRKKLRSSISND